MFSVITPSLPDRQDLLNKCLETVSNQIFKPQFHLIGRDFPTGNMANIRNALVEAADALGSKWVAFVDDDDELDPDHFQKLFDQERYADVLYSWHKDAWRYDAELPFDRKEVEKRNYLTANFAIKTKLFKELGGFKDMQPGEEWDFWKRLAASGAVIKCLPEVTWEYRRSSKR